MKVLVSLAYVWIPDAKRTKLDSKSQKLMFTGYSHTHKAYRLIDVNTDRLIFSRDVVFDEELGPFPLSDSPLHSEIQSSAISDLGSSILHESSDATDTPPQPPLDNTASAPAPHPAIPPAFDIGSSTLRPKWWAKTISDLRPDELIEGRTSRNKSIQHNTVNIALMANIHSIPEPQTYAEAKGIPEWEHAMDAELQSLQKNHTWVLSDLPLGKKPISCKWVYKVKYHADGTLDKYKARLVARGFTQREGIDYEETFAPTAKMSTIRILLAIAAQYGWKVHQMDVKSAFLNGELQEEVYMTQPPGFKVAGSEPKVCRLQKAIYGLKQAPRAWYIKIDQYLVNQGFQRSPSDSNLYIKHSGNDILFLVVYVDDLIITGNSEHLISEIKQDLCRTFDMTDLGLLHYCLGIEVWQTDNSIFLSQSKYARNLLDRFRMQDCKPASTPMETGLKLSAQSDSPPVDETLFRQLVGSLIYLTTTRPDLSFAVSYISRFMSNPKTDHWIAAKRVLRYVHGTSDYGLLYTRSTTPQLSGFTDSDWAGSVDDRKSTSGYVFSIGSAAITWTSKKQQAHALSSTEAEYRGAVKAACEAVWLRQMLADMHISQAGPTSLFSDNQAVLKLAKNPVFHERTKHIELHCHYIRQLVEDGSIQLLYVPTSEQPADIFTKPLGPDKFVKFRGSIGVVNRLSIMGGY